MLEVDNDMYSEDNIDSSGYKSKNTASPNLGKFGVHNAKSSMVEINGKMVEIINKSYVDKLEVDFSTARRDLRAAQVQISRLIRAVNVLSTDVSDIRRKLRSQGRFD